MSTKFIVISGRDELERVQGLNMSEMVIGRSRECSIRLPDVQVSRNHAKLMVENDRITIKDLGSMNGTYVNGNVAQEDRNLLEGDVIQIGPYSLQICNSIPLSANAVSDFEVSTSGPIEAKTLLPQQAIRVPNLTPAQRRILEGFLEGKTEREIAIANQLSPHTVHTHAKAIYKAYGISTRAELLARHQLLVGENPEEPS